MALSQTSVLKLYNTVIEDVIVGVRESFADEGVDEQVLQELKQIWESKLMSSKAVELNPDPPEPQPPQINAHKGANKRTNVGNHFVQQAPQTGTVVSQQQQQTVQAQNQLQLQQTAQQQMLNKGIALPQATVPVQQVVTAPAAVLERQVPIQITLPAQGENPPRVLTIHVPVSAISGNQLQSILTAAVINAAMALPPDYATSLLQQHVNNALQGQAGLTPVQQQGNISQLDGESGDILDEIKNEEACMKIDLSKMTNIVQLDGAHGDSSEDEDEEEEEENDEDDEDLDDREEEENDESAGREEEPLNSGDDVSEDDDPTDLFDTENVVVCQYDKITRSRNKWKFYLKDGIMNLNGKDYVFQKATGDAEW